MPLEYEYEYDITSVFFIVGCRTNKKLKKIRVEEESGEKMMEISVLQAFADGLVGKRRKMNNKTVVFS